MLNKFSMFSLILGYKIVRIPKNKTGECV
jgi:hypothetical protein